MKYIYSLLLIFPGVSAFSQFNINVGYSLSAPQQQLRDNIKPLHSLSSGIMYQLPGPFSRVQAGIDFSLGTYANTRKKQTFNFGNGTSTKTWVDYSSNVVQASLAARFFILQNKKLMPYINGKAGYTSFFSDIKIEDPDDPGGCKPLQHRTLIKDGTISAGYGGGLQLDWSLFSKKVKRNSQYLDISINQISGNNVEYINTKKLIDAANPPTGTNGKPLNVQFINTTTQQIHEHEVAEVYNTPLRMLECKISMVFLLVKNR
jgi:hypothetical protein